MKLREFDMDHVLLRLSLDELGTAGNALNEVCNGIRVDDFESKMGGSPSEVEQILDDIIPIYRQMERSGTPHVLVRLSRYEMRAIIGALKEVCHGIDEFEFATRMGAERAEVDQILDEITPIYLKIKQLG